MQLLQLLRQERERVAIMNLHRLDRILDKYGFGSNNDSVIQQQQRDESQLFYDDLRAKYERAYKARKDKFFAEHPDTDTLTSEFLDDTKSIELSEWIFHLFSYLRQTPEQIYQEQKMAPLDHDAAS